MYLLDVNALLALGFREHEFHGRVAAWLQKHGMPSLAARSIPELGFLRVLTNAIPYGIDMVSAVSILEKLKSAETKPMSFLVDDVDATVLPKWVQGPIQITEGHLMELAKRHGAKLATLDGRIPSAFVIPST